MRLRKIHHHYHGKIPRVDAKWLVQYVPGANYMRFHGGRSSSVWLRLPNAVTVYFRQTAHSTTTVELRIINTSTEPPMSNIDASQFLQRLTRIPIAMKYQSSYVFYDKDFLKGNENVVFNNQRIKNFKPKI